MPPRIRTRASKALKENIDVAENKLKSVKGNTKVHRKALADKTNSASDDTSVEVLDKSKKTVTTCSRAVPKQNIEQQQSVESKERVEQKRNVKQSSEMNENVKPLSSVRPRRDRRLPTRFVETVIRNNLSSSKDSANVLNNSLETNPKADNTPAKNVIQSKTDVPDPSPLTTPAKTDNSLLAHRPKRICRLPSRFEDHSISPSKYIPIKPANASTPIQQSKTKPLAPLSRHKINTEMGKELHKKQALFVTQPNLTGIVALQKELSASDKSSPDSNNNAKVRSTRIQKAVKSQSTLNKKQSKVQKNSSPIKKYLTPINKIHSSIKKTQSQNSIPQLPVKKNTLKQSTNSNKISDKNLSFKVLGAKKTSQESVNNELDVYEFTFDPNEEPQPKKKKRKKAIVKKPSKPKTAVYKSSYDQNISKAIAALKTAVKSRKSVEAPKLTQITESSEEVVETGTQNYVTDNFKEVQQTNVNKGNNMPLNESNKISIQECNYPSIRVEDIAADIEQTIDHHDDINYSPVNTPRPNGFMTPNASVNHRESPGRSIHNNDPLNLLEELSFFDDQPVASSSMNTSVRHPLASPWRVEFGSLPIKWPVNTYVKPNMTPAVESSFISSEDSSKKKHVYTNMLPETNDILQENTTPNFKQTSIISFIQEMAEKSAKKKRGKSDHSMKAVYEEIIDRNAEKKISTKKDKSNEEAILTEQTSAEVSGSSDNISTNKDNSKKERINTKHKNGENICDIPAKSPRKQKDKDCTYFGFDESENQEQENVSPIKINNNLRGRPLRSRSRAVLHEINGPTRAALPVAAKTKIAPSSEVVNRVYEDLKLAADATQFPEKNIDDNATNLELINDDSQSVHLFEDIELIHHMKPTRKSYGKSKKVTFRQVSTSDSDTQKGPVTADQDDSSDYDDLADLSFEIANVKEKKTIKKKKPKNLRSKKEEQEANVWAANFNSMCEDIDDFCLLVE